MIEAVMLWNEPNNKSHWDPEVDPDWSRFAEMATLAARAIRAENAALPRVLGGISPIDPGFIRNMDTRSVLAEIDVLAVHGFPLDWNLWQVDEWPAKLAEIRIAADTAAGNVGEQAIAQLHAEAEAAKAKAQSQIERLDAESAQARARLSKLRDELQQVQKQAELQVQRLQLARQEAERSEGLAARGLLALRDRDARRAARGRRDAHVARRRRRVDCPLVSLL